MLSQVLGQRLDPLVRPRPVLVGQPPQLRDLPREALDLQRNVIPQVLAQEVVRHVRAQPQLVVQFLQLRHLRSHTLHLGSDVLAEALAQGGVGGLHAGAQLVHVLPELCLVRRGALDLVRKVLPEVLAEALQARAALLAFFGQALLQRLGALGRRGLLLGELLEANLGGGRLLPQPRQLRAQLDDGLVHSACEAGERLLLQLHLLAQHLLPVHPLSHLPHHHLARVLHLRLDVLPKVLAKDPLQLAPGLDLLCQAPLQDLHLGEAVGCGHLHPFLQSDVLLPQPRKLFERLAQALLEQVDFIFEMIEAAAA
mmetsp:Transcript_2156/g.6819  ORF Transcript_2156/g.6819 Transcript_2156/m.6819 type:complete len:311 (-) Transcript_2156:428-1360(-)